MIIADLLIEYIGYEFFQDAIRKTSPTYVSCIIQINTNDSFVSDSPYLHVFNNLDKVHHQMKGAELITAMKNIGYELIYSCDYILPNQKKFSQLDFIKQKCD